MEPTAKADVADPTNYTWVVRAILAILLLWVFLILSGVLALGPPIHAEMAKDNHLSAAAPAIWATAPFVLLLMGIAVLPLWNVTEHWWESNWHRFYVSAGLGLITVAYYLLIDPAYDLWGVLTILNHAVLEEYVPFMVLLFSLFVITGGIRVECDIESTPVNNTILILIGGLLASFIGTTGAAMLLIRPLLEMNRERRQVVHTVVFFIFIVCNCGGCLLPIGDPPLFMGYLEGVHFLWTIENLWLPWLVCNVILLGIYLVWDFYFAFPSEEPRKEGGQSKRSGGISIEGIELHAVLLLGVVLAIALLDPRKTIPFTTWHPWPFLREAVQLSLVALSLSFGQPEVRARNRFNLHPIAEVAAIFIGIFITMQPALALLKHYGAAVELRSPLAYFWGTGILSSFLDNAPTYLVFFKAADSRFAERPLADLIASGGPDYQLANQTLIAISLGAVFLGAMTYIGNGPNFMVRAIAEEENVKMPSFLGYLAYSGAVLLPVYLVISIVFLGIS